MNTDLNALALEQAYQDYVFAFYEGTGRRDLAEPDKQVKRAVDAAIRAYLSNAFQPIPMTGALGRFGHHPHPAIDFCVEVEELQSIATDRGLCVTNFNDGELEARVERAMKFTVGGDPIAVAAKDILREIERALQPTEEVLPEAARYRYLRARRSSISPDVPDAVTIPLEPTRELWAAMGNAIVGLGRGEHHHDVISAAVYKAIVAQGDTDALENPTTDPVNQPENIR